MALAVKISPEELLEFKRDFEELLEAFYYTVLTQGQCNHGELSSLTWLTNDASRHQF